MYLLLLPLYVHCFCRYLSSVNAGVDLNFKNSQGATALMIAIERGHESVVNLLLAKSPEKNDLACFKLALTQGHMSISVSFFSLLHGDNNIAVSVYSLFPSSTILNNLIIRYGGNNIHSLEILAQYAGRYNFFFDLYLEFMIRYPVPDLLIGSNLVQLFDGLRAANRSTDVDIIHKLVLLIGALKIALRNNKQAKYKLEARIAEVSTLLVDITTDSHQLQDEKILHLILCYQSMLKHKYHAYSSLQVEKAQAFTSPNTIDVAIKLGVKSLFSSGRVSKYRENVFYSFLKDNESYPSSSTHVQAAVSVCFRSLYKKVTRSKTLSPSVSQLFSFKSDLIYARYSPVCKWSIFYY